MSGFTSRMLSNRNGEKDRAMLADEPLRPPTFSIYQGADGQWYWHLQSGNNRVTADGAEGYSSRDHAARAVQSVIDAVRLHESSPVIRYVNRKPK